MPILETGLHPEHEDFQANREHMLALIHEFRGVEDKVKASEEKARPKFAKRDQLLPRERLQRLLDPGAEFLELMSLAGYRMHDDKDGSAAGGGLIAGATGANGAEGA